ncbi:hypothetical protein FTO68_01885 [Methanocalculus taiwanensis]|uniref:Uncharacterized protein n=1 Tax=Methanocalculus taiwanensis TaxID=106207 RepID=A0ABD4TII1_9EURY|nr:hypothetical protein [Methanocalculus taiwanensis]MCQ1537743.1 hypothetical protein [Methanocalculus taiwanensis]
MKVPNPHKQLQPLVSYFSDQFRDLIQTVRHPGDSDEAKASFALFIAAAASFALVFFTDRADMTSATLVLCGFACFIAGIFLLTFHRGGTIAPDIAERLTPGCRIGLARISADLGVDGDAVILPEGESIIQFNASGASKIPNGALQTSLVLQEGSVGVTIPPLALPLWDHLRKEYGLTTPDGVEASLSAIREVLTVASELAETMATSIEGDDLVIEISGYHLFGECMITQAESPKCCTMFPCAACGLIGVILADATKSAWCYDRIVLSPESRTITITLRRYEQGM